MCCHKETLVTLSFVEAHITDVQLAMDLSPFEEKPLFVFASEVRQAGPS